MTTINGEWLDKILLQFKPYTDSIEIVICEETAVKLSTPQEYKKILLNISALCNLAESSPLDIQKVSAGEKALIGKLIATTKINCDLPLYNIILKDPKDITSIEEFFGFYILKIFTSSVVYPLDKLLSYTLIKQLLNRNITTQKFQKIFDDFSKHLIKLIHDQNSQVLLIKEKIVTECTGRATSDYTRASLEFQNYFLGLTSNLEFKEEIKMVKLIQLLVDEKIYENYYPRVILPIFNLTDGGPKFKYNNDTNELTYKFDRISSSDIEKLIKKIREVLGPTQKCIYIVTNQIDNVNNANEKIHLATYHVGFCDHKKYVSFPSITRFFDKNKKIIPNILPDGEMFDIDNLNKRHKYIDQNTGKGYFLPIAFYNYIKLLEPELLQFTQINAKIDITTGSVRIIDGDNNLLAFANDKTCGLCKILDMPYTTFLSTDYKDILRDVYDKILIDKNPINIIIFLKYIEVEPEYTSEGLQYDLEKIISKKEREFTELFDFTPASGTDHKASFSELVKLVNNALKAQQKTDFVKVPITKSKHDITDRRISNLVRAVKLHTPLAVLGSIYSPILPGFLDIAGVSNIPNIASFIGGFKKENEYNFLNDNYFISDKLNNIIEKLLDALKEKGSSIDEKSRKKINKQVDDMKNIEKEIKNELNIVINSIENYKKGSTMPKTPSFETLEEINKAFNKAEIEHKTGEILKYRTHIEMNVIYPILTQILGLKS